MFSRFSEEAQKALILAKKEMNNLRHPYVGSEHLFLSILSMKDLEITVKRAIEGVSDKMIAITRLSSKPYKIEYTLADLSAVANYENKLPRDMINEEGNNVTEKFIEYAAPLIDGELDDTFTNGLIDVPHLKNYRPL